MLTKACDLFGCPSTMRFGASQVSAQWSFNLYAVPRWTYLPYGLCRGYFIVLSSKMYYTQSRRSIVDSFFMQCSSTWACSNGEPIGILLGGRFVSKMEKEVTSRARS